MNRPAVRFLAALLLTLAAGCGLDEPAAPRFETDVYLPIGTLRYEAGELTESVGVIEGDTTVAEPLRVQYAASIDSVELRDRLRADIPERSVAAAIGPVAIDVPTVPTLAFRLGDMAPFDIPPGGLTAPVPAFDIRPVTAWSPSYPEFVGGRIAAGRIEVTLRNGLPIPIEHLRAHVVNASGAEIAAFALAGSLAPGGRAGFRVDLAGKWIDDSLRVDLLSGSSPGSASPITLRREQSIGLDLQVEDLRFSEVLARIPPDTYEERDSVAVGGGFRVESAAVEAGLLPLRFTNGLPLALDATIVLPQASEENGRTLQRTYHLDAGEVFASTVDLAGATIRMQGTGLPPSLVYQVRVAYEGSGDRDVRLTEGMGVSAQLGPATLRIARLTGVLEPRAVAIPVTRATFDMPAETRGIEFTKARLELAVENGSEAAARIDLVVRGRGEEASAEIRLQGTVVPKGPAGPVTTHLVFDETNSRVLDLVNARPEEIAIEGTATVGDGVRSVTIRPDDAIRGTYVLTAPLRVRVHEALFEPDPLAVDIDPDLQELIREDLVHADTRAVIANHLPFAVTVRLRFASDSSRVRAAPDVELQPVRVESAFIDPSTGRVSAARESVVSLALDPDDIPFFARDSLFAGVAVRPDSSGTRTLEVMTTDWIEVSGSIRFGLEVGGP